MIIPEDEIAYIALHIGVMLEETEAHESKTVAVVYVPDYYDIGRSICDRLRKNFDDILIIKTIVSGYDQLQEVLDDSDIVISTYHLPDISVPVIEIGPLLSDSDIRTVAEALDRIRTQRKTDPIIRRIENYLYEDLCYFNQDYQTSEDAIRTVCQRLRERDLIDESFEAGLFEHERIAPTAFKDIVITHTLNDSDLNSFISMSVNSHPIQWGNNQISVIFVISLIRHDRNYFKDIFNFLIKVVSNEQAFIALLKARNYQDFKTILQTFL